MGGSQGTDGQVLTSTGSGIAWENAASGGLSDIVSDTSPQLGGSLDVNGQDIVSTSNGAIELDPNGSGVVTFKGNATRGAGQFKLNCEQNSHGITIKGPPHSAAASYTLTLPNTDGNADQVLKTNGSGVLDWVDASSGGGGGGMWTQVATTTISSEVHSIEFSSLGSYTEWQIRITGLLGGSDSETLAVQFDYGSGYVTSDYRFKRVSFDHQTADYSSEHRHDTGTRSHLPVTGVALNRPTISHAFGTVGFTNTGSRYTAEMFTHYANTIGGLNIYKFVGDNQNNLTATISKIKFVMIGNFADNVVATTNHGVTAGIFTLYGRVAT